MSTVVSHEVFNPSTPRVDQKLFTGNRALQDALRFNLPAFDAARFAAPGAAAGSAQMQGGSNLRANTSVAEPGGSDAWGQRHLHFPRFGFQLKKALAA